MTGDIRAPNTNSNPRVSCQNMAVEIDVAGNLEPSKKKSTERIDGIGAGIMALGRALLTTEPRGIYTIQRRSTSPTSTNVDRPRCAARIPACLWQTIQRHDSLGPAR